MQYVRRIAELGAEVAALRARLSRKDRDDDPARFLSALLEAVPAFILRADPDLRLRYINRLQPGLSREGVLGRSVWDFVEPANLEEAQRCVARVLESGVGDAYETVGVGANGATAPYKVFVAPVEEGDGRRGICMVAVDQTLARRREQALDQSEEKLRLALDATGMGLWTWTPAAASRSAYACAASRSGSKPAV